MSTFGFYKQKIIMIFFIQAVDEAKSVKSANTDRLKQLQELNDKLNEHSLTLTNHLKMIEDDIQSNMSAILSSDDKRKTSFQLAYDEEQQIVAVSSLCFYFFAIFKIIG